MNYIFTTVCYLKGMTHFMTLATFSVRSQADIAPQGQFLPMITLYYVLSIMYTFIALIWFIVADHWTTKQNVPKFLVTFAAFIKRILFLQCYGG